MKDNLYQALIAFSGVIVFVVILTLGNLFLGLPLKPFLYGNGIGVLLGGISSAYLMTVWDPKALAPKNPGKSKATMRWVVAILIIILFAGRVMLMMIGKNKDTWISFFLGAFFSWVILTLGFLWFQAWKHHPRKEILQFEERTTNLYMFPLSTTPQTVLRQVLQEMTRIVASLQNNLDRLQKDSNSSTKKSNVVFELGQNVDLLDQLQASAKNYLDRYNDNLSRKEDELNIETRLSSLRLLEMLMDETRHSIKSIHGWVGLIRSYDDPNFQEDFFRGLDEVLITLKDKCTVISSKAGFTKV